MPDRTFVHVLISFAGATVLCMTGRPEGPDDVRERLIEAARECLTDYAPRQISSRQLAAKAGVDAGAILEHFGSFNSLIALVWEDIQADAVARRLEDGNADPRMIDTSDAARRFSTFARLALDGDLSMRDFPALRAFVKLRAQRTLRDPHDPDVLAEVAAMAAMQLGWGVMEDYVMAALEPYGPERDDLRARVAELSRRLDPSWDDELDHGDHAPDGATDEAE